MGSIYLGIATPEESAAIGATVAILIAVAYAGSPLRHCTEHCAGPWPLRP